MTTYHGNSGKIKIGANTVAEVKNFTVTEGVGTVGDNAQGDTSDTHLVGRTNWNAQIEANHYKGDTSGQALLIIGASVAVKLYAVGDGTGAEELTGTATVTGRTVVSDQESVVSLSLTLLGNGTLTHAVVP